MTKDDLKKAFGSLSAAAKAATAHGEPISAQAIAQWDNDKPIRPLWAGFFYLIQQKRQLSINDVFGEDVKND